MLTDSSPIAAAVSPTLSSDAGPCHSATGAVLLLILVLSATLHFVAILQAPPLQSANDRSRWCTVRSLIEERTYRIDRVRQIPGWDTIDLIRKDGHFYSTKPPLMATWVATVVELVIRVTGWNFGSQLQPITVVTLLLINWLPFLLGLTWLTLWLRRSDWQSATQVLVLTVAAFGTLVSPFLMTLNNHTPAAFGVLLAVLCWLSPAARTTTGSCLRFFVWGCSASWAACHDLPAAAFTLTMLYFALHADRRLALLSFVPGAALPALALLLCNLWALGSMLPAYSGYGGETYRFIHEGVPSYWLQPQGIDRNLDAPWTYFLHCTVGHHGWWSLTPVWLLVLLPLALSTRAATLRERHLLWVTAGLSGVVLAFYLTRTGNYNYGGVSCGLRWAVFLTPLWLFALGAAVDRLPHTRLSRGVALACLAGSVFSAWQPMSRPWQQPWLYQWASDWGWVPGRDPPPPWQHPLHSWFADLPAADAATDRPWVEFQQQLPSGGTARLRLSLKAERQVGSRNCAVLEFRRWGDRGPEIVREYLIDRVTFAAGRPAAECLVWTDSRISTAEKQADMAWFRGLPALRAYSPGFERYLKTGVRVDALPCQRAAAQVDYTPSAENRSLRYRSDLWLSPEVPFGTARVEWSISDPRTGESLQRECWELVDSSPKIAPTSPLTVEMFDPPARPIIPQVRVALQQSAR